MKQADVDDICYLPALELRDKVRAKEISPVEVADAVFDRIERVNGSLNAFITITKDEAYEAARASEKRVMAGEPLPLDGVPVTVKDLTDTAGVRTTYGSVHFTDHVPTRDERSWARMRAVGAMLVGKTTTPEFGMSGVTESPLFGATSNPWDLRMTSGGSSGGAASSVAAGLRALAWGSDGGGSVRVPAACCGVVGLKPSMGRIPKDEQMFELVASEGPLTRTVSDTALMLSVTAGPTLHDPTSIPDPPVDFLSALDGASLRGKRIAYSPDLGQAVVAREVRDVLAQAMEFCERELGAVVEEIDLDLPDAMEYMIAYWSARWETQVDSLEGDGADSSQSRAMNDPLVKLAEGRTAAAFWTNAVETRSNISKTLTGILERFDVIVTPTMPVTAFPHPGPIGGNTHVDGTPVKYPGVDFHRMTDVFSRVGLPAITVPCGFSPGGLPVGMQIVGPPRDDIAVMRAALAYEQATPWHTRRPL